MRAVFLGLELKKRSDCIEIPFSFHVHVCFYGIIAFHLSNYPSKLTVAPLTTAYQS